MKFVILHVNTNNSYDFANFVIFWIILRQMRMYHFVSMHLKNITKFLTCLDLTSNDYHCEVKFKWGFKKSFMMSLLFENCKSVDLNSRHSINIFIYGLYNSRQFA